MKKWALFLLISIIPLFAYSSGEPSSSTSQFHLVFFFIVILLFLGRIGALIERFNQPSVLGELLMGIMLAALVFLPGFKNILKVAHDPLVEGVAEIGVILLLFRTGIESNINEMKRVGGKALLVAIVGVILPFFGCYFALKALIPGIDNNAYLFFGATLTATSVGVSTRVFKDLNIIKSIEAQIVLGAAVIDDVLGLLILAVMGNIVDFGHVEISMVATICFKSLLFFIGAILIGRFLAPFFVRGAAYIHSGIGMKLSIALVFCGGFAYAASAVAGLAPIIGAFVAGLILEPEYFKQFDMPIFTKHLRKWTKQISNLDQESAKILNEMKEVTVRKEKKHIENLIEGVSDFFIPIFFVYTGLQVDLSVLSDIKTVMVAVIITVIAFGCKFACGYMAGKNVNRSLIGVGMVPRGEVGLIFLNVGQRLGVVNPQIFAIGVIVVILTTLLTPPALNFIISKQKVASPSNLLT